MDICAYLFVNTNSFVHSKITIHNFIIILFKELTRRFEGGGAYHKKYNFFGMNRA